MLWNGINFLINFVEIYLVYYFLHKFYEHRINNKAIIFALLMLQTIILSATNYYLPNSSLQVIIINLISVTFISYLIYKEFIINIMAPVLIWLILLGILESIVVLSIAKGFNVPIQVFLGNTIYRIMAAFISRLAMLFLINRVYKITIVPKGLRKIYLYQMLMVLILDIPLILLLPNMLLGNAKVEISIILVMSIVILASFSIIRLFNTIMQYAAKEAEYDIQVQYIKSMNDFIQQLRAQRHDFNHHIGCIYGLLQSDEFEEARVYTEQIVMDTEELNSLINTNNPYITAILNHKLSMARKKDINLEVDVVMPSNIVIEPVDLSIIIGNALDNAIEACEKVSTYKFIEISIHEKLNYIIINVKNSKNTNEKFGVKKTTKIDEENHGFGLGNIKYVVDKYLGKLEITENEEEFSLSVLLNNIKS